MPPVKPKRADDDRSPPEARHLDDLTEVTRALNITLARAEEAAARRHREQLVVLQAIAANTACIPALIELLRTRANGTTTHEQTEETGQ